MHQRADKFKKWFGNITRRNRLENVSAGEGII